MAQEWDFNTALGETIREKYESLYVKVVEVSSILTRRMPVTSNYFVAKRRVREGFRTWDWKDSLGETIMEKRESLYLKIINMWDEVGGEEVRVGPIIGEIFDHTGTYSIDRTTNAPVRHFPTHRIKIMEHADMPSDLILMRDKTGLWHGFRIVNFME